MVRLTINVRYHDERNRSGRRERGAWTTTRHLISWAGLIEDIRPEVRDERIACGNAVGVMPITWEGKAALCAMDVNGDHECGDVNTESRKSIWKRRNRDFFDLHMKHRVDELPEICRNCTDWEIIGSFPPHCSAFMPCASSPCPSAPLWGLRVRSSSPFSAV